jgi:hypothetical protein
LRRWRRNRSEKRRATLVRQRSVVEAKRLEEVKDIVQTAGQQIVSTLAVAARTADTAVSLMCSSK